MSCGESRKVSIQRRHGYREARADHAAVVAGEAAPDRIEQSAVDLEDDLEVARQQRLEPRERPPFERLGQQRMVRVRQRLLGEVPGLIPAEARLVEQDPQQLGNGHRRVRVIELDGDPFGKRAPVSIGAAKSPDQVAQRARDEKVLLHEPQSLPAGGGVVGIKNASERLGGEGLGQRVDELAMTEALEIEVVGRARPPQAQRVDRLAAIAHYRPIEWNADQRGRPADDRAQRSSPDLERAVQPDLDLVVGTSDLPRIGAKKPVVRLLVLPTVLDGLPEHSVLVPEPVPHRRQAHGGHRIEKARGQTPEPAISQPGVGFLLEHAQPIPGRLLVVEEEVPLVERVSGTRERDRTASVLPPQRLDAFRGRRYSRIRRLFCARPPAFSPCPRICAGRSRRSGGISSQRRITGSDRSRSYPIALRLAVPSRKYLPAPGSSPSQRAANTRRKCPLENSSVLPSTARTRRMTRSARAPICSGDSPPGATSRNSSQSGRSTWISALVRPSYAP